MSGNNSLNETYSRAPSNNNGSGCKRQRVNNEPPGAWSAVAPPMNNSANSSVSPHTSQTFNNEILVSDAMAKNSRQLLYAHIYNYLLENKHYETAKKFLKEADVPLSKDLPNNGLNNSQLFYAKMLMDSPDTFLLEWWESLWTLHEFVETQPAETVTNSHPFNERIAPILPQRPNQGTVSPQPMPQQQQPHQPQQFLQRQMGMSQSPLTPQQQQQTQPNMGPPRQCDSNINKAKTDTVSSSPEQSRQNSSYQAPPIPTAAVSAYSCCWYAKCSTSPCSRPYI